MHIMTGPDGKARILVIDDEHVIADTLRTIFSKAGMEAKAVYSAEQALALMPEWDPHMAIIDVHLPGMNGIEFAIRCMAEYPNCRLALFSGYSATAELLDKARQDGFPLDVLAKPVHPADLLRIVTGQTGAGSDELGGTA